MTQPYEQAGPRPSVGEVRRAPVSLNGIEAVGENLYAVTIMANETARGPVELVRSGIDYSGYEENPVVLWIHDHSGRTAASGLPIGATRRLVETASGEIRAWFEFLTGDPFVERIKNAWDQGFLRAASIGWRALESEPTAHGWRDTRSELLEWSLVPLPADPGALRSAYEGMIRRILGDDAVLGERDWQTPAERVIFDRTPSIVTAASLSENPGRAGSDTMRRVDLARVETMAGELSAALVRRVR